MQQQHHLMETHVALRTSQGALRYTLRACRKTRRTDAVCLSVCLSVCPVQFFSSPPIVLLLFISRFAIVRQQIDSNMTRSQKKIRTESLCLSVCLSVCLPLSSILVILELSLQPLFRGRKEEGRRRRRRRARKRKNLRFSRWKSFFMSSSSSSSS